MPSKHGLWIWTWIGEPSNVEQARTAIDSVMARGNPKDQVDIISAILSKIDNGELTSADQRELDSLRNYAADKLAQANDALNSAIPQADPTKYLPEQGKDLQEELKQVELLDQKWDDEITQWGNEWRDKIAKIFQFKGTFGFGYGGPPVTWINNFRLDAKIKEFRAAKDSIISRLRYNLGLPESQRMLLAVPTTGPNRIKFEHATKFGATFDQLIANAQSDFNALKRRMDNEFSAWVNKYRSLFGMTNFVNFAQQWFVGKILGGIGNLSNEIVMEVVKRLAPRLTIDVDAKAEQLRRGAENMATRPGGQWAAEAMKRQADYLSQWTFHQALQHGAPKEGLLPPPQIPPLGPLTTTGGPINITDEGIKVAMAGVAGFSSLAQLAQLKTQARVAKEIDTIAPGSIAKLAQEVSTTGEDPEAAADKWIELHKSSIEALVRKAAEEAWKEIFAQYGQQLPQTADDAIAIHRKAWQSSMQELYNAANRISDYMVLGEILQRMQALNYQAPAEDDRRWGDGLIAIVEQYYNAIKAQREKQVGVKRSEDAFSIPIGGKK